MSGIDICRMMKRRLKIAGLPDEFSPHSFRVTTVTDLLEQNAPLEDVQYLAGNVVNHITGVMWPSWLCGAGRLAPFVQVVFPIQGPHNRYGSAARSASSLRTGDRELEVDSERKGLNPGELRSRRTRYKQSVR